MFNALNLEDGWFLGKKNTGIHTLKLNPIIKLFLRSVRLENTLNVEDIWKAKCYGNFGYKNKMKSVPGDFVDILIISH